MRKEDHNHDSQEDRAVGDVEGGPVVVAEIKSRKSTTDPYVKRSIMLPTAPPNTAERLNRASVDWQFGCIRKTTTATKASAMESPSAASRHPDGRLDHNPNAAPGLKVNVRLKSGNDRQDLAGSKGFENELF